MSHRGKKYFFNPGANKIGEIRVKKNDIEIYEIPSGLREKLSRFRIIQHWRKKSEKIFDFFLTTIALLFCGGFIFFVVWAAKNIRNETLKVILIGTPIGWMGLTFMVGIGLTFVIFIFFFINWVVGERRIGLLPIELEKFVAKFSEKKGVMVIIEADVLLAGWILYQENEKVFWEIVEKAQDRKEFLILTGIRKR